MNPFMCQKPKKQLRDVIPSCVPDGWWVFKGVLHKWYFSEEEPALEDFDYGMCWETEDSSGRELHKQLFPDLYAFECPIEEACFRVDRSASDCNTKSESTDCKVVPLHDSPADLSSEGWLPNPGKMPCDGEMEVWIRSFDGDYKRKAKGVNWFQSGLNTHWKPAGSEWVLHDGEGMEHVNIDFEAIRRDGTIVLKHSGDWQWHWRGQQDRDVIWYRVIEPQDTGPDMHPVIERFCDPLETSLDEFVERTGVDPRPQPEQRTMTPELVKMQDEALEEHRRGETLPMDLAEPKREPLEVWASVEHGKIVPRMTERHRLELQKRKEEVVFREVLEEK